MKKDFTGRILIILFALFGFSISQVWAQTAITGGSATMCTTTGTANWNATGLDHILVFVKAGSAITPGTPTTNYTAYGAASTDVTVNTTPYQNDAAASLIFKGTSGTSVSLTNLTPGTQYFFLIYNTNGTTGYSAAATFNATALATPGEVSGVTATPGAGTVSIAFTDPTTCFDDIMIVASTGTISTAPSGTAYTGGIFGSGTAFGTGFVVFKASTGSPALLTGFAPGAVNFKIWSRSGNIWSAAGVTASATVPPAAPAAVSGAGITATCTNAATISWTNPGTVAKILVFVKAGSSIAAGTPTTDATTISANPVFASGDQYQNDNAAFCVYNGTGTSVNITGLAAGINYYVLVYNASGTSWSTGATSNGSTPATPPDVTGVGATPGAGQVALNWTNPAGCSDLILVVADETATPSASPSGNGSAYTANAAYGGTGATAFGTGFVVYKGTGTSVTVTGLTNCAPAHFRIFTLKGTTWSSGTTASPNSTPTSPPAIVSLSPANSSSNAATNTDLVLTFNVAVALSGTGGTTAETSVVIKEGASAFQSLDISVPADAAKFSISGNTVTINMTGLNLNKTYSVAVGDKVFAGCGTDFAGITAANWSFQSTPGVTLTAGSASMCPGTVAPLGDIVFTETAPNNITGVPGANRNIRLKFDNTGFAFQTGPPPTVTVTSGRDIQSATVSSISFSSSVVNIVYAAGTAASVNDDIDKITISGLNVIADGTQTSGNVIIDTSAGTDLQMQGISNGQSVAALTSNSSAPAPPSGLTYSNSGGKYCAGTVISSYTVSFSSGSNIKWYSDASLTTTKYIQTGSSALLQSNLGINPAVPGTTRLYATQSSGCQSAAVPVDFTIYPAPGADAGTFATTQCSGTQFQLGGAPTVSAPSTPPYHYAWKENTGNFTSLVGTLDTASNVVNPPVTITNSTGSSQNFQFEVTVRDANGCTAKSVNNFNIYTQATPNLTLPASTSFTTSTPPQTLGSNFTTTSFTGVGVIQVNANTYRFDPTQAYDNTKPLPQFFDIFFTGTDPNGCPVNNYKIATMTLSNSTFPAVQGQYCAGEYPVAASGVSLALDPLATADINAYVANWNSTQRNYYIPAWSSATAYDIHDLVIYAGVTYRAGSAIAASPIPPVLNAAWTADATAFQVVFTGTIRNYYEGYYGGNIGGPTISKVGSNYFLGTNANYVDCPSCNYEYPASYVLFKTTTDIGTYIGKYHTNYYFYANSSVITYQGRFYKCLANNNPSNIQIPGSASTYWQDVTGGTFDVGAYFYDAPNNQAGYYTNGQYVVINPEPAIAISGFKSMDVCQSDVSGPTSSVQVDLLSSLQTGGIISAGDFDISFDNGTTWLKDAASGSSINNNATTSGAAMYDSQNAYAKGTSVATAWASGTNYSKGATVFYNTSYYISLVNSNVANIPSSSAGFWQQNTIQTIVRLSHPTGATGSNSLACASKQTANIKLHKTPALTFSGMTSAAFCNVKASVDITTTQTTGVKLTGYGVTDNLNGTAAFDPSIAFNTSVSKGGNSTAPQVIAVTAFLTDGYGCTNTLVNNAATPAWTFTVNPPPAASYQFNAPSGQVNIFNDSTKLVPLCYNDAVASPFIRGQGTAKVNIIYPDNYAVTQTADFSFNSKAFYDDAVANHTGDAANSIPFRIEYINTDGIGCTTKLSHVTFSVSPTLPIEIVGIGQDSVFCSNEGVLQLSFVPYIAASNPTFKINNNLTPIGTPSKTNGFDYPLGTRLGVVTLEYNMQSGGAGSTCQSPAKRSIVVLPSPQAFFDSSPKCDSAIIDFKGQDISSASNKAALPPGNITSYSWLFQDSKSKTANIVDTVYQWKAVGNYAVTLNVSYQADPTYNEVCQSQSKVTQVIGAIPVVDFSFSNVCSGDATHFVASQANGVTQYKWDFGDGVTSSFGNSVNPISAANTSGSNQNPIHIFTPAPYVVTVTGQTDPTAGGCVNSKTRPVSILKYLTNYSPTGPYKWDAGGTDWVLEDRDGNSSWHLSSVAPDSLGTAPRVAWNNITYKASDHSYVNSPCFDLSQFTKPAIGLEYFMDVRQQQDGAVLQFSRQVVNGIQKWETLGSIGSGQNWYTTQGISGKPGDDAFNPTFFGWSAKDDSIWNDAKHSLDTINGAGKNKIRFRIAFGSDGGSTNGARGFAFTNVSIVERNRVSLVENFTNDNINNINANNAAFQNYKPGGSSEVVKVEYHTSLPTADLLNKENSEDPNARAAFYGLTNSPTLVPRGYLDGTSGGNFATNWLAGAYKLRSLKASPLNISLAASGTTGMKVTATALSKIKTGNLRMFVMAVQTFVTSQTHKNKYVARKIFPSASGAPIPLPLDSAKTFSVTVDPWMIDSETISDSTTMEIIAFVQDIDTREVIQAFSATPLVPISITTGFDIAGVPGVYPNPSNKEFVVELPEAARGPVNVRLVNLMGQPVSETTFQTGETRKTIPTQSLSEGVYILELGNKKAIARKKVMVIH